MSNLRIAAYETLMELIKNSPKDCYPIVQQTTIIILKVIPVFFVSSSVRDAEIGTIAEHGDVVGILLGQESIA